MSHFGFLYDGRGYRIDEVDWIAKPGRCEQEDPSCPMAALGEDGKWKCVNTMVGHSCKHVVNGNANEKARYKELMSQWLKDENIPESIQSVTDEVVNNYKKLSHEIIQAESPVSIVGDGKKIRIICDGIGILDGAIDCMSFEVPWREDYFTKQLFEPETDYKILGIISSYFNLSSADSYVMYRLVYQRYFEKKNRGRNVSPTIRRTEGYSPADILPEIDLAFDQARLFYREKKDENFAFGAIFYFFWSKYVKTDFLKNLYQEMMPAFVEHRKPGHLIWDDHSKSNLSKALERVKKGERIFSARTILEYIEIIAGSEFDPNLNIWQGDIGAIPSITDYMHTNTKRHYKEKERKQFEMIIQKRLLDRVGDVFENRYKEQILDEMSDFIEENERNENVVGAVADYASYTVANYLTEYFVVLYVFCHNSHEIYKGDSSHCDYDYIREQVRKWNNCRDNCTRVLRGGLFNEWMSIFNNLYQVDKRLEEIENY